ncbi:hypothetical protein [Vibrio casei]|uniref:hypothetical protein n=1 Tax=Vibrio casei TaxID=673372 RepID=UPI000B5CC549|nr:hypothetical protein [Vibrio casei]
MIYLETLSKNEVEQYSPHLIKFYICYKKYKNTKVIIQHFTKIYGKKFEKEIGIVFTALAQASKNHAIGVRLPVGRDYFSPSKNKAIAGQNLNRERFIAVLKNMDTDNLLTFRMGCADHFDLDGGALSEIIFSKSLFDMVDNVKLANEVSKIDQPLVVVKDTNGNLINTKNMQGVGRTSDVWRMMEDWHNIISKTEITVNNIRCATPFYQKQYRLDQNGEGRNYVAGGGIQTMPKSQRSSIRLNDQPCSGMDYKNLQVRLCYTLAGVELPDHFDCYSIKHDYPDHKEDHRKLCKSKTLALLFSKSKAGAVGSVRQTLREDLLVYPKAKAGSKWFNVIKPTDPKKLNEIEIELQKDLGNSRKKLQARKYAWLVNSVDAIQSVATKLIEDLSEHNKAIADYFYRPTFWQTLQNLESRMMDIVIQRFIDRGECLLSWHDGAVTVTRLANTLKNDMKEAYEIVMGTSLNCVVESEFMKFDFVKSEHSTHFTDHLPETEEETLERVTNESIKAEAIPDQILEEDHSKSESLQEQADQELESLGFICADTVQNTYHQFGLCSECNHPLNQWSACENSNCENWLPF